MRVRDGKRLVTDGPFAETREQLGGYFLIDAKDLDEAIAIAARIPGARIGHRGNSASHQKLTVYRRSSAQDANRHASAGALSALLRMLDLLDAHSSAAARYFTVDRESRRLGCYQTTTPCRLPLPDAAEVRMKYLCLISMMKRHWPPCQEACTTPLLLRCSSTIEELRQSGHAHSAASLTAVETATTVRVEYGRVSVTDGPFAETQSDGGFPSRQRPERGDPGRVKNTDRHGWMHRGAVRIKDYSSPFETTTGITGLPAP